MNGNEQDERALIFHYCVMRYLLLTFLFLIFVSTALAQNGQPAKPNDNVTKLKIKSTPKATYTDEATKARISGIVRLRVEFLASGKIGTITDVTENQRNELEIHGLTCKAINAAKGIKFSAEHKDGNPITVVRTLEFNFTLF